MQQNDKDITLTYSCILNAKKEKIVQVMFEREGAFAEGSVPTGKIVKHKGFTKEEVDQLEIYLEDNKAQIMRNAKEITGINNWFL